MSAPLTFAVPKGRILDEALPLMARAGVVPEAGFHDKANRALSFTCENLDQRIIRVRAFDVATFVAHGAAQMGIVGSDVVEEFAYPDLYAPVTRRHFESLGIQAEVVKLNGAMELAPGLGLASRIVDLVETGRTLKDNGLEETSTILEVSARLIVNRAALKTDPRVGALVERFREQVA
jgi:ATP phosphoribosyltransferase